MKHLQLEEKGDVFVLTISTPEKNIIDAINPKEVFFDKCMALAKELAKKDRKTYTAIKHNMRHKIVELVKGE